MHDSVPGQLCQRDVEIALDSLNLPGLRPAPETFLVEVGSDPFRVLERSLCKGLTS